MELHDVAAARASQPAEPGRYRDRCRTRCDALLDAGSDATSHDVYFGSSSPPASAGNQAGTTFDPVTLTAGTTYYWRIDEVNASGTTTGTEWSFTTLPLPGQASLPSPADTAIDVALDATLSWTAGSDATSHDVYFGSSSPPASAGNQAGTTFDPVTLTAGTTYYWRIDEVNASGTTTGVEWSFTTLPLPGQASLPSPADAAIDVALDATLSWTAGSDATSHDVYFGSSSPPASAGNQAGTTFDPVTLTAGTTYYWRIDEVNASGTTTGTEWSFTTLPLPGQASLPSPADAAIDVALDATLSWTAGSDATSHDVYFGSSSPPASAGNQAGTTFDPVTLTAGTTYYWRIDEVNASGTTTGVEWSFTTLPLPGQASLPSPADTAIDVALDATLSWTAGSDATSHDVYFGSSSPPASAGNQAGTTFDPVTLTAGTTYYWRIDEVNASGTTTGTEWSFTTLPLPGQASLPSPADAAIDVALDATLSWTAGSDGGGRAGHGPGGGGAELQPDGRGGPGAVRDRARDGGGDVPAPPDFEAPGMRARTTSTPSRSRSLTRAS